MCTMKAETAVGEFSVVLRGQVAAARRALAAAREARDHAGIVSHGLRLRYLLQIAEEHGVDLPDGDTPGGGLPTGLGEG
jgi:hypothetical protein